MKASLSKKLIRSLAILTSICLFQNCSSIDKTKVNSTAGKTFIKTGLKCPLYQKPNCLKGETTELVENKNGCSYFTCAKENKIQTCPQQSRPLCAPHQSETTKLDSNSCFFSFCKLKSPSNVQITTVLQSKEKALLKCPAPSKKDDCPQGTNMTFEADAHGCLKKKCKKTPFFKCEVKASHLCKKTETAYTDFDEKGCAKLVCKNNLKIMCPNRLKASCKWNENIVVTTDLKGCKKTTCAPKSTVQTSGCKLSKPPSCKLGQMLTTVLMPNSCRKITCR